MTDVMGLKKKKPQAKSCTFSYIFPHLYLLCEKVAWAQCSDFVFLSSFSVAKACSANRLLQYFVMMYMLSSANTLKRATELREPPS